jgi:hypothetical protein
MANDIEIMANDIRYNSNFVPQPFGLRRNLPRLQRFAPIDDARCNQARPAIKHGRQSSTAGNQARRAIKHDGQSSSAGNLASTTET